MEGNLHRRASTHLRQAIAWMGWSTLALPIVGAALIALLHFGFRWADTDSLALASGRFQVTFLYYSVKSVIAATAWTLPTVILWLLLVTLFAGLEQSIVKAVLGMGAVFLVTFSLSYGWVRFYWDFPSGWLLGVTFYLYFAGPRLWLLKTGRLKRTSGKPLGGDLAE
jgi:hypothetical protein